MFANASVTAFTVFELLRENQLEGEGGGKIITPPRLGLKSQRLKMLNLEHNFNWQHAGYDVEPPLQ